MLRAKTSQISFYGNHIYDRIDVLNGIAHDATNGRLFVTGKLWPWLFEIELVIKR